MKKMFKKLKTDAKFARAGPGHRLDENTSKNVQSSSESSTSSSKLLRAEETSRPQSAGAAAASRFQANSGGIDMKAMKRQLLLEQQSSQPFVDQKIQSKRRLENYSSPYDEYVMYFSPFNNKLVVYSEFRNHVEINLKLMFKTEPLKAACMMIKNLNKDTNALESACNVLKTIVNNIIGNPKEEKFRKVKKKGKTMSLKVLPVIGCEEFLLAIGFLLITNEENEECFYISEENVKVNILENSIKILNNTKVIEPQLSRNKKVQVPEKTYSVKPSKSKSKEYQESFYQPTSAEIKQLQTQRTKEIEISKTLRTRAMRETDSKKVEHKFCLLRFQLSDQTSLEGVFKSSEKIQDVKRFVLENLNNQFAVFDLTCVGVESSDINRDTVVLKHISSFFPKANVKIKFNKEVEQEILTKTGVALGLKL